jgi:hypothetical protein
MTNITKNILPIKGKVFEVFGLELYCQKYETINFFIMTISSHINIIIVTNCWMLLKKNLRQDSP